MKNEKKKRDLISSFYSGILGILYAYFGSLEIIYSLIKTFPNTFASIKITSHSVASLSPFALYNDIFAGFTLLVLSSLFIIATIWLYKGQVRGYSYILSGLIISSTLAIVQILILGANWAECCLLQNEDFTNWSWVNDFRAIIPLWLASIPLFLPLRKLKIRRV